MLSGRDRTPTQICQAHILWSRQQTKRSHLSAHTTHSLSAHEALTKHQATSARCGAVNENQTDTVPALTELTCAVPSPDPLLPSLGASPTQDQT